MGDLTDPAGPRPDREQLVALLSREWATLAELLGGLADEQWTRPALPGWDVHDVVAHVVGTERQLSGEPAPPAPLGGDEPSHVRTPIGQANERWVLSLRDRSHSELLDELRAVTAGRLAALEQLSEAELRAPAWTPAGEADYGRFMEIRIFDCYMHEQDIRVAVGRPGHEDGPVADAALREVVLALGYIVGKRVGAPDGSRVTIALTGPIERQLHVAVDGRATLVAALDGPPTAAIALSSTLFLRLAGGRLDPASVRDQIRRQGDPTLAERLATNLAYTI